MPETKLVANMTKVRFIRLVSQFLMFIIVNGAILNISYTFLILPINQPFTPISIADGALFVMQRMLSAAIFPFIPLASFALIGAIIGRFFCGWGCPFGLVQEITTYITAPVTTKYRVFHKTNKQLVDVAWVILLMGMMVTSILGLSGLFDPTNYDRLREALTIFADEPLSIFEPAAILFVGIPYLFWWNSWPADLLGFDPLFYIRLLVLLVALILPMFIPRAYCRWACPTGVLIGKIGTYSMFGIKRSMIKCNRCGRCEDACSMGVPILEHPERIRDILCILCLDCIETCDQDALKLGKGG
ncbi:MAG: 4Fe-4S binding protein [Candidatus Hodarchaeales archaeon]|jgi:polyferredoxin